MTRSALSFLFVPLSLVTALACDLDPAEVGEDPITSGGSGGSATTEVGSGGHGGSTTSTGGPALTTGSDSGDDMGTMGMPDVGMSTGESGSGTTGEPLGDPCDPLLQDCPESEACYPAGDGFHCAGPIGEAQPGDACVEQTDCDIGTLCRDDGVCTPFCDVNDLLSCDDPGDHCEPWFPEGMAPPGLEDVGACEPGAAVMACDPLLQDCAAGEACHPWLSDFGCLPEGPGQAGDACAADGDCGPGVWCDVDVCLEFCDLGAPVCSVPGTSCEAWYPPGMAPPGAEDIGSCAFVPSAACDPLLQDCPAGEGCYPDGGGFSCDGVAANPGQAGDVCGMGCDLGLLCNAGVCVEFCDTTGGLCSDPGDTCLDYYMPGDAPPGLETVGYCG